MTKVKESIRTPRPARTRKPSKGQQVGYLRVSSLDQNEVRQLEGLALDKTFTDRASGKDVKRPQLEAMQSFVREGDTVLCHSMDRLARNLDDLRRIVLGLTERGIHIVFVKEKPDLHRRGLAHVEFAAQFHGGVCSVRKRTEPRAPA